MLGKYLLRAQDLSTCNEYQNAILSGGLTERMLTLLIHPVSNDSWFPGSQNLFLWLVWPFTHAVMKNHDCRWCNLFTFSWIAISRPAFRCQSLTSVQHHLHLSFTGVTNASCLRSNASCVASIFSSNKTSAESSMNVTEKSYILEQLAKPELTAKESPADNKVRCRFFPIRAFIMQPCLLGWGKLQ